MLRPRGAGSTLRRHRAGGALLLLLAVAIAGCGAAGSTTTTVTAAAAGGSTTSTNPAVARAPAGFAWLAPATAPAGWSRVRLAGSGAFAYPASWHRVRADPGAGSAALVDPRSGLIVQYLNATPQQGDETAASWATFRAAHNAEEGDRHVQVLAAARDLRFLDGRGSCVIDRYQTTRTRYQEIACLVRGPAQGAVIVAAAQADQWSRDAPGLERAVSAFVA